MCMRFVFLSLHLFCVSCEFTFVPIFTDGYLGIFAFCFVSLELDRKMKGWALIFRWYIDCFMGGGVRLSVMCGDDWVGGAWCG